MSARRWVAAVSAAVVAAGLGAHTSTAEAETPSVGNTSHAVGGFIYPLNPYPAQCPDPNYPPYSAPALVADGKWHTRTARLSGHYDTTDYSGTSRGQARLVRTARGVARLELKARTRSRINPVTASPDCGLNYDVSASARAEVTVPRRSWLSMRHRVTSQSGRGQSYGSAGASQYPDPFSAFISTNESFTRLVRAGTYEISVSSGSRTGVLARQSATRIKSSEAVAWVALIPVGTIRVRKGNALPFLSPGHRDCSQRRVKVTLSQAGRNRSRSITLSVNGQRRAMLRGKRLQRTTLYLNDIRPGSAGLVEATVVLKNGGRRTLKATSWPCA